MSETKTKVKAKPKKKTPPRLVALLFDDPYKADEARAALYRMAGEQLLELEETAVISKPSGGKTRISQDINEVQTGQKVGQTLGIITAAVTGVVPFVMLGTLSGRLVGMIADDGITNAFIRKVNKELTEGTSVLLLVARASRPERMKIVQRLQSFEPTILHSELPAHVERSIKEVMLDAQANAAKNEPGA